MSARIACWLNGHDWGVVKKRKYEDLFGNLWRFQACHQCLATRRFLHRAWDER